MTGLSERAVTTREALLDAAQRTFAAGGFERTTLRDVTATAGLTTGAFYRYFPTKTDVIMALLDRYVEAVTDALVEAESLDRAVVAWLELAARCEGTVRAVEELSWHDADLRSERQRHREVWASSLVRFIRPDAPVRTRRTLARLTLDALDYHAFTRARGNYARPPELVGVTLAHLIQSGLYTGPPSRPGTAEATPDLGGSASPRARPRWEPAPNRVVPRSARGRAQREVIIEAAAVVLAQTGYAGSSVAHFAERAGVSAATVYRYFVDKRDIFRCLMDRAESELFARSVFGLDAGGRLVVEAAVTEYFVSRRRDVAVYSVWRELLDTEPEMERQWFDLRAGFQRALEKVVRAGQRRGCIIPGLDAEMTSELVVALFDGAGHARVDLGYGDGDGGDTAVVAAISLVLSG